VRVAEARLRLIQGRLVPAGLPVDPLVFQSMCIEAFVASWTARGFAASTIDNDIGVLERMLNALGRPAWEVTAEDVDRVVGRAGDVDPPQLPAGFQGLPPVPGGPQGHRDRGRVRDPAGLPG
jgi:hypothetical protein